MPKPFRFHEVFAVNGKLQAETRTIAGLGDIVIIDDFYRDPQGICDLLQDSALPPWKITPESRNFVDYHDCRLSIPAHHEFHDPRDALGQSALWHIAKSRLGLTVWPKRYEFNFSLFQWIHPPGQETQFFPHVDGDEFIGAIIYLNPQSDPGGGTAFYRGDAAGLPERVGYREQDNAMVNIPAHCDLIEVVPGKFNRCIMFPGCFLHGAYIGQHDFYTGTRWRMNQIYFLEVAR